ncbi:hypothetical protein TNCV_2206761 [Trichonephila clavipes]|uniref:Uncharacterized protein n=1 Tax=Trichonephila clavipes TaxID=2585209 RepID=A0A8X6S5X9_TRICX|nr:hypothetical protein TNCV_2206761 [Trichonephila clavipes]
MTTVPSPVFITLCPELHEQMFKAGDQSDVKPQCLVPKQAWVLFIDPLNGLNFESTLPSPGFELRCAATQPMCLTNTYGRIKKAFTYPLRTF